MIVTINDREYELKELTKEEAKEYIGKEVYVWDYDKDDPVRRKLIEVFEPDCPNPFCTLDKGGKSTYYYPHCAPVPEEWYVYETTAGSFFHSNTHQDNKKVDHGSEEYCIQKAQELNEREETAEHPLTSYELGQLLKCFGVESSLNISIRYKCGEWMPATRETVWKWWEEESGNSDISRFVSFMGWFEDKEN